MIVFSLWCVWSCWFQCSAHEMLFCKCMKRPISTRHQHNEDIITYTFNSGPFWTLMIMHPNHSTVFGWYSLHISPELPFYSSGMFKNNICLLSKYVDSTSRPIYYVFFTVLSNCKFRQVGLSTREPWSLYLTLIM